MERLIGRRLPDVELAATDGSTVNPARLKGFAVIFCYPWTGRPGHPNPPGWDTIPGAHGSTPQIVQYSRIYQDFHNAGVKLFGASFQEPEWQEEFARRHCLTFLLLADAKRQFSGTLGLPVFTTGGVDYLKRLTLIAQDGVVETVRFPVTVPEKDAEETLALLQSR